MSYEHLIHMEFGRLKVVAIGEMVRGRRHVLCDCICGVMRKSVNAKDLSYGKINSCGCRVRCSNTYEIENNEAYLIITDTTLNKKLVNIDAECIDKIKQYNWIIRKDGYVKATTGGNKYIYLHRLLMDVLDDSNIEVDHINQIPSDNRICNLRLATHSENNRNIELFATNTSGNRGVYFDKKYKNWYVHIRINNKSKRIGSYKYIEDAIKARQDAELKYYGDFSPLNSEKVIQENIDKIELDKINT